MVRPDGSQFLLVHYGCQAPAGPAQGEGGEGQQAWQIACAPNLTRVHAGGGRSHPWQRSGEVAAVTCPLCQDAAPYREAKRALEAAQADDGRPPQVHYAGRGLAGEVACGAAPGGRTRQRSDDPRAVTCPACRESEPCRQALEEIEVGRTVIKLLPDQSGKVCIHYFVHAPAGPAHTPAGAVGPFAYGGAAGYIACSPKTESVTPRVAPDGTTTPVCHSNEPRAVTCPRCKESREWVQTMAAIEATLDTAKEGQPAVS